MVKKARKELKEAKAAHKSTGTAISKAFVDKKQKALQRLEEQLTKLEVSRVDKVRLGVCVCACAYSHQSSLHPSTAREI